MAILRVYKGPHWMDELTVRELAQRRLDPVFEAKYQSRFQRGDILDAYADGSLRERPNPNTKNAFVNVPDLSLRDAMDMVGTEFDGDVVIKRARRRIKVELLQTRETDEIDTGEITLSREVVDINIEDKRIIREIPIVVER